MGRVTLQQVYERVNLIYEEMQKLNHTVDEHSEKIAVLQERVGAVKCRQHTRESQVWDVIKMVLSAVVGGLLAGKMR